MMHFISTDQAPSPGGHYSQAVVRGDTVYVSGQLPLRPGDRPSGSDPGTIDEQTERVLANLRAILVAAGSDLDALIQVTVYIADISQWGRVNEVYARVLGNHRPARAVVPTPALHHGFSIEVQAIAAIKPRRQDLDVSTEPLNQKH